MTAFQYRMPAGIPGAVTRNEHSTVETMLYDSAASFPGYGLPVKVGTNEKSQPFAGGEAAAALYGLLVRPFPAHSTQDPLGTSTPPTSGISNVLRRGYMTVKLNGGAAVKKNGQAYIRVAAAATGKPIGGIEGAADSTNTIAPTGLVFTGAADGNGNVEVAFNI